jgi:hypothetical protein
MANNIFGKGLGAYSLVLPEGLSPDQTIKWMVDKELVQVERIDMMKGWIQ